MRRSPARWKREKISLTGEDMREGLTAIASSVKLPRSQVQRARPKDKLVSSEVRQPARKPDQADKDGGNVLEKIRAHAPVSIIQKVVDAAAAARGQSQKGPRNDPQGLDGPSPQLPAASPTARRRIPPNRTVSGRG